LIQILSIKDWNCVVPRLIGEIAAGINAVSGTPKDGPGPHCAAIGPPGEPERAPTGAFPFTGR